MYCDDKCPADITDAHCTTIYKEGNDINHAIKNQLCLRPDGTHAPPGCCRKNGCPGQCKNAPYKEPDKIVFGDYNHTPEFTSTQSQVMPFVDTNLENISNKIKTNVKYILNIYENLTIHNLTLLIIILSSLVISSIFML